MIGLEGFSVTFFSCNIANFWHFIAKIIPNSPGLIFSKLFEQIEYKSWIFLPEWCFANGNKGIYYI